MYSSTVRYILISEMRRHRKMVYLAKTSSIKEDCTVDRKGVLVSTNPNNM